MGRLAIRGGKVIDGSGAPARQADVLVVDGRIAEVGERIDGSGARVIDASGAFVTPGFIEGHTHLDPSLFWDRSVDPMPQHGVTTVLIGNCSLGLAPMRPELIDEVSALFCYIEDLPRESFDAGIHWGWESYAQYAAALDAGGLSVHVAALLGHSMLRMYVMGAAAWERAARPDELGALAALMGQAVADGAFGFSTSFFDTDSRGRPVPSRLAAPEERAALVDALARHGRGIVQVLPVLGTPEGDRDFQQLIELCGSRVASTTNALAFSDANPVASEWLMQQTREYHSRGVRFWPQMSPRTVDFRINWESSMVFMALEPWHRIPNCGDDSIRAKLLRDPEWRAAARKAWDTERSLLLPTAFLDRIRFTEVKTPELRAWEGKTLADLQSARGGHPSDLLADWVLENDLRPGVVVVGVANSDVDGVGRLLSDPDNVVGSSDAGAHLNMLCAAGDTTLLLTRHVRERGDLTLEAAVHELTGKSAEIYGLSERGHVRPGLAADLTVFALGELEWADDVFVDDLPGGARRLRRPPGGFRYTIANGEITQEAGRICDARPARVLHSAVG